MTAADDSEKTVQLEWDQEENTHTFPDDFFEISTNEKSWTKLDEIGLKSSNLISLSD